MKSKKVLKTDIVLLDVIGFSKLEPLQQLEIINFITATYKKIIEHMLKNSNMPLNKLILGFVSTGDGFYCIINPRLKGYGTILGLSFNHLSEEISKRFKYFKGMQIAVHHGDIYEFTDILGHKNYIGDGLNDCARYLELRSYTISTVMVSDSAYQSFKKFLLIFKDFNTLLLQKGFKHSQQYTFLDKHGDEKKGWIVWLRESGIINPPNMNFNSILYL
jgi:hypothetical protein